MPTLLMAAASPHSSQGFPRWIAWVLLILFLAALAVCIGQQRTIKRLRAEAADDAAFPGWDRADGADIIDAITDPDLPAVGYERHEPVADTVIFGKIVDDGDWREETAVPAPAITAKPVRHEQAMAWIEQWEREDAARQRELVAAP